MMETIFTGEEAKRLFEKLHPVIQCDGWPMSVDLWADDAGDIYLRKTRLTGAENRASFASATECK